MARNPRAKAAPLAGDPLTRRRASHILAGNSSGTPRPGFMIAKETIGMGASDLESQFTLIAAIYALTAIVWLGCALTALAGYRAFRLKVDLGWFFAFLLLAFVRAGEAYVAYITLDELRTMGLIEATATELSIGFRVSFAALEIIAAFAVFILFRSRSRRSRRRAD